MSVTTTSWLPTFSLDDIDGMAEAIRTEGVAFIPDVLSAEEIAEARAAIDRLKPFGYDAITEWNDHYKCVFNRESVFLPYADRPGVVDLAERLMGDQCHIIGMTTWRSRPGFKSGHTHADKIFMPLPEGILDDESIELPVNLATAHYYLSDVDEDLCPTWVLPGSHRSGCHPARDAKEWRGRPMRPVTCKAGDVLFFRSEVWHSGSNNVTPDRTRYLLQVHYSHRDIAQKFSPFPFHLNPEVLATANERQLRLLGKHPETAYG